MSFATIQLQKMVSMRSAMDHKYPDVQFIFNALTSCSNQDGLVGSGESDGLSLSKDPAIKSARVLQLCFVFGRQAMSDHHKNEGKRKDNRVKHFNRHQREIPRLRILGQYWFHFRAAAGDDQTARFVDSRRHQPGMRSGDASPPQHLHRDDERVGDHRQAAQESRLARPGRSGSLRPDKPNGNWDRKASQILYKYQEPGHPVVPGTTSFE